MRNNDAFLIDLVLADDNILPQLPERDSTPLTPAQAKSKEWIDAHIGTDSSSAMDSGSPYQEREDGTAELTG